MNGVMVSTQKFLSTALLLKDAVPSVLNLLQHGLFVCHRIIESLNDSGSKGPLRSSSFKPPAIGRVTSY